MKKIHIIGGGTFSHVRNHLALAAPAFGQTARALAHRIIADSDWQKYETYLHLTKMADHTSKIVTNEDVSKLLDTMIADPDTRVIILNAALCDYDGSVRPTMESPDFIVPGAHAERLKTSEGLQIMHLTPAEKLIGKIRKERKDIFVVGFKTTTNATSDEQYQIALNMLKRDSLNLVLANDTVTRNNMIVAPEETRYGETTNRQDILLTLVRMVLSRIENTFTRSTVVDGDSVAWNSPLVPDNLRIVVDHMIASNAYKPVRGVTAGHFAVKVDEGTILTSKRKTNFNQLADIGLVKVEYEGDDRVVAFGAKPSVGGQSQRVIFREHPELDCIVHAHVPLRPDHRDDIPIVEQWGNECGSHQCGGRTSSGLKSFGKGIKAVMLEPHGPNIVFSRDTPANDVIEFIEANFDLSLKTGGMVA